MVVIKQAVSDSVRQYQKYQAVSGRTVGSIRKYHAVSVSDSIRQYE